MKDINVNRPIIEKCYKRPIQKRACLEAFRKVALEDIDYFDSIENIEREGEQFLRRLNSSGEAHEFENELELNDLIRTYREAKSLDTCEHFLNGIDTEFHGMAILMFRELSEEFKVKSAQDKAYLQMAISAFCLFQSNMVLIRKWKHVAHKSREKSAYVSMLTKQADCAFRQYQVILQHLEVKKRPPLHISVKAQNAIVGQNQQFNSNSNENIKA